MIEFRVLGPLALLRGDRPIAIGGPQQRRLLAALLVHAGEVVPVDWLLTVLWGDDLPPTALKSLRTRISRLRDVLADEDLLLTRSPGYALRVDQEWVDAGRFERLVSDASHDLPRRPDTALAGLDQALGLWRGRALAEFADDEFARVEAARLEELRLAAIEGRFEARLALGDHAGVVGEIEAFTKRHPLRERPWAQLMLALYRSGRQADALAAYQRVRALLADELGLEPAPELSGLEHDILQQNPVLDWSSPPEVPPRPHKTGPGVPAATDSFVGRDEDRAALAVALVSARLVTLTGAGGIGKTRLAQEVALAAAGRFPDGVWWCDLAAVTHPEAVGHAVTTAVGAHQLATVEESVVAQVGGRRLLLVVDNCEHVLPGVVPLVTAIMRRCPHATVLATSRTRLAVDGERLWPVSPLPVPARDDAPAPSMELFLDRARAVRPALELTEQDAATIASVCRQLDGLPLAIELAAARMRALNPADIAQRLDDRFRFLAEVRQGTDHRHRTMRAVVDWSYGLLSRAEQHLFDRLSAFAGGFTLAAAETVAAGGGLATDEILDLLAGLVDHSMVATGGGTGPIRYRLLETLRQYGRERLAQRGEQGLIGAAHAHYFAGFAAQTAPGLRSNREAAAVAAFDQELANLRAAHTYAVLTSDTDLAMRLTAPLLRYALWRLRAEVFQWAAQATELPGAQDHSLFPLVCAMAGWGRGLRGDRAGAAALAEQALAASGERDPVRVYPLEVLAHVAMWEGRLDECRRLCRAAIELTDDPYELLPSGANVLALAYSGRIGEAVTAATDVRERAERLGNPTMRAMAAYDLGEALMKDDVAHAMARFEEAVSYATAVGNRMVAGVAAVSATSLRARHGDPSEALRSFRTMIDHLHQATNWTHLWTGLRSLVELFVRIGANDPAAILYAAVTSAPTAPPVYGDDADRLTTAGHTLAQRLGAAAMAEARARAADMADDEVLGYARVAIDEALAMPQRESRGAGTT